MNDMHQLVEVDDFPLSRNLEIFPTKENIRAYWQAVVEDTVKAVEPYETARRLSLLDADRHIVR